MARHFLILALLFAGVSSVHAQTTRGVTLKVYDIREDMDKLYPLSGTPTPNLHELRTTIDYLGSFTNPAYEETYENRFLVEVLGEIQAPVAGTYSFRLTSDDGSVFLLDAQSLINHDGLHGSDPPMVANATLTAGFHPFQLRCFQNTGAFALRLEWKQPGDTTFTVIPASAFRTEVAVMVSSPGKKNLIRAGSRPGNGQPLVSSHPQWEITDISRNGFAPKVGDIGFLPNGDMLVATFEPNRFNEDITTYNAHTRLYRLTGVAGDPTAITVTHVAGDGLAGSFAMSECTGLAVVAGEVYLSLRDNVYRIRDTNSDGIYDQKTPILATNWEYHNFHQFVFSLTYVREAGKDYLYGTISTAVDQATGNAVANKSDYNGSLFRVEIPAIGSTSAAEILAGGLRTPNGVSLGPEGRIFVADNQGSWNPANSLTEIRPGRYYGHRNPTTVTNGITGIKGRFESQPVSPKSFLLPQGTLSNSPTEGILLDSGPYAGQLILGELTGGGLRRVAFDKVQGEYQGAVFHFAQGFEAGINRMVKGPDGALYVGCMGSGGNWAWQGKLSGLQRVSPRADAPPVFEMKAVTAVPGGLEIEFTNSVPLTFLKNVANYTVKQWTYTPTAAYGGANVDEQSIVPAAAVASPDRRRVQLYLPTLKEGYCVYLKTDPVSDSNLAMWATEAWYTLNRKPASQGTASSADSNGRIEVETGLFANGPAVGTNHPGFTGSGFIQGTDTPAIETIRLTATAPAAGTYPVTMRYTRGSNSGAGTLSSTGSFDLSANGGQTVTFALPMTADWAAWAVTAPVNLTLKKGDNTLLLRNPYGNGGICNIDRLDIDYGLPTIHPPATVAIDRNAIPPGLPPGTAIAQITGTDPDGGQLTYELGFNNLDFTVADGRLRLRRSLPAGTYPLAVRAIDSTGLYKETTATITVANGPDADHDGIDDLWESVYGLDPTISDAGLDSDGDGQSNLKEYYSLTDPRNFSDFFCLADWTRVGTSADFVVQTRIGRRYQLQRSMNLENWDEIGTPLEGDGEVVHLIDDSAPEDTSRLFYRVVVTP